MNTITQEELDRMKESLRPLPKGQWDFLQAISPQVCIKGKDHKITSEHLRSINDVINLAPSLIAAAEDGLKAKPEIADNLKALEESAALVNKLDNEKQDLRARVQELDEQREQWRMSSVCREKQARIEELEERLKKIHQLGLGSDQGSVGYQAEEAHKLSALSNFTPQPPRYTLDGWRNISTAPKDGTEILGCIDNPRAYAPCAIVWASYHPNAKGKECWRTSRTCGNKMDGVTHWMPLPPRPQRKEGA